jgi:DnaJ-domain-containing protein 1
MVLLFKAGARSCVWQFWGMAVGGYFQSVSEPGQAAGWGFAEEVGRRMGEGFEPDARFMEESWTMGVDAAEQSFRARREGAAERERRDQVEREQRGKAFREVDSVGARAFAQASEWYAAMRRAASGTALAERGGADEDGARRMDAAWLQQCAEEPFGGWRERGAAAADGGEDADAVADAGMTVGRARRVLGLSVESTREQVRAAYRRMAGEWHPDRVAGQAEEVRKAATEQMAEINDAYRMLRGPVGS